MSKMLDDFARLIYDQERWEEATKTRAGRIQAKEMLAALKRDLRHQRVEQREKLGGGEFGRWLAAQSRFERQVSERTTELIASMTSLDDNPVPALRAKVTVLTTLIGKLAYALDKTGEHDVLLKELTIPLGNEELTLAEAIDDGRWDAR